jgi:hypothetical protein
MKKNEINFKEASKRLNDIKSAGYDSTYSMQEIVNLFARLGFPKTTGLFKHLKEYAIIQPCGRGKWQLRRESPIHYMTLMKAYVAFRKDRNSYIKKYKGKKESVKVEVNVNTAVPAVVEHVVTEEQIQTAIQILKACGDRFQITEKKVTVTYEVL